MTNFVDVMPLTPEEIQDPISIAQYFLDVIKSRPGLKVGIIGRAQSGTTTAMQYLSSLSGPAIDNREIQTFFDARGVPDTLLGTVTLFDDLTPVVKQQIPEWWALIEQATIVPGEEAQADINLVIEMVQKMSQDMLESRQMLKWKGALNLFALRDLGQISGDNSQDVIEIYELPALPINYNEYFDVLIKIERNPNWFTSQEFQEHFEREQVPKEDEIALVTMRDEEFQDYAQQGDWQFNQVINNNGTIDQLQVKLIEMVKTL
jgi:hypothetical protein